MSRVIHTLKLRACPLTGDDIDTDRIIPARYLKCVTFDGLGEHAFKDDRFDEQGRSKNHPLDDPRYQGTGLLIVGKNFGCGSSREHAPQALKRFGFDAILGESFAEIFFGNCVALGIPCLTLAEADIHALHQLIPAKPELEVTMNLETLTVTCDEKSYPAALPRSVRDQFLRGAWDQTGVLLDNLEKVRGIAAGLPYTSWPATGVRA